MKIRGNDLARCRVAADLLIGFVAALVAAALGASAGTPRCMADEKEPHALQGYGRV